MKERMQKTSAYANDCLQRDRSATEWYGGVQTFIWMTEDNIVEVPFDREHLLEVILSPENMNKAYKAVVRNKGKGGIDKMSCEQLLPWLLANKDELIRSLLDGTYRPNPVRRVEIPKDDTVNHSKLIEILSRTIKDGRVVSLIHKYLRSGVIDKGLWHASEEVL